MPFCVFRWCSNYIPKVNKTQGITYHSFPADKVRCQEWISIVRAERCESDWIPSKSSTICSMHFNTNDTYNSKTGRRQIKKDAIPIIVNCELTTNQNLKNSTSSYCKNVDISNKKEISESALTVALKKRVNELMNQNKLKLKRNLILTQQNKRLKKRVVTLAVILRDLNKNSYFSKRRIRRLKVNVEVID